MSEKIYVNGVEAKFVKSWDELSHEKFVKIYGTKEKITDVAIMSILSGVPEEDILADPESDLKIFPEIEWCAENPDIAGFAKPEKIIIKGLSVKIPKDLSLETYGQKISMQEAVAANIEDQHKLLARLFAIYVGPKYMALKNNEKKVVGMSDEELNDFEKDVVSKLNGITVYSLGTFFLMKTVGSMKYAIKKLGLKKAKVKMM